MWSIAREATSNAANRKCHPVYFPFSARQAVCQFFFFGLIWPFTSTSRLAVPKGQAPGLRLQEFAAPKASRRFLRTSSPTSPAACNAFRKRGPIPPTGRQLSNNPALPRPPQTARTRCFSPRSVSSRWIPPMSMAVGGRLSPFNPSSFCAADSVRILAKSVARRNWKLRPPPIPGQYIQMPGHDAVDLHGGGICPRGKEQFKLLKKASANRR